MATQTRSYKQSIIPPFLANGLMIAVLASFLLAGAYTGYLFYHVVKRVVKETVARTNMTTIPYVDLSLPLAALPITGAEGGPVILPPRGSATGPTGITGVPLPNYEQDDRVNILLLGIDSRPTESIARSDTMILVTIDPSAKTAGMLSIPRDLYVYIPGYGEDRINKAYFFGEKDDYPGGGPALAMKTIQETLGVPIHFYAQVDFQGFRDAVDTLGGIDIYVPETIDDPNFPDDDFGYDPLYIEAGQHTLNGHDALRYARTRVTPGSDFSRAWRQQAVLFAIRDKALQLNMVSKVPELWSTMDNTVETNLQLVDIVELSQLAREIDPDNIKTAVIDQKMTIDHRTETGALVLLPVEDKIQALVDEIFESPQQPQGPTQAEIEAAATEAAQAAALQEEEQRWEEMKLFISQENARVIVQNGTATPDLASPVALYLKEQGFNVTRFGLADAAYPHTVIVVYDDRKQYTLQVLTALFEVEPENVRRSPSLKSEVDFRVLVGDDFDLELPPDPIAVVEE
jgi:LCP family protein required for cell wall assembly